jgi:hypothetical protein
VPRIYLEIAQFNRATQHALRRLHQELPDDLGVKDAKEEGPHRVWVTYPDRYGEDKARAAVRDTLAKITITGIEIAEPLGSS